MKNLYLIINLVFCTANGLIAQQSLSIKEHYDALLPYRYVTINPGLILNDTYSWIMKSSINMYKATKDKAYLIKFINQCILMQKNRYDELYPDDPSYPPKWTVESQIDGESSYFNGYILEPMAEYIYLVLNDNDLYNSVLPTSDINNDGSDDIINYSDLNSMYPVIQYYSYGTFASWLSYRVEETIQYMNDNYWNSSLGMLKTQNTSKAAEINWQSGYATALLYMALTNTNNSAVYLAQARKIAQLYTSNMIFIDPCVQFYNEEVLLSNYNNAYWWYHNGWRMPLHNCWDWESTTWYFNVPDYEDYTKFIEDVSHGAMTLDFPMACNEHNLTPMGSSTSYFSDDNMIKFKNTFTFNIWDRYDNIFHNNVMGTDNKLDSDPPYFPNLFSDSEILNWMPLYKFDEDGTEPNDVYNLLLTQLGYLINDDHDNAILHPTILQSTNISYLSGPRGLLGLSEAIIAQWDKECPDLTLKNRDVVYDQDFFARNILTVDPSISNNSLGMINQNSPGPYDTRSFAEPYIYTQEFIIESGVTVNMEAGEKIVMKAGSSAKAGCHFRASINPSLCIENGGGKVIQQGQYYNSVGNISTTSKADTLISDTTAKDLPLKENSLNVYPNPNDGNMSVVYFLNEEETGVFEIYDVFGKKIYTSNLLSGNNTFSISESSIDKGIYFYRATVGNEQIAGDKIVVIK